MNRKKNINTFVEGRTQLEHMCQLDVNTPIKMCRITSAIVTIGEKSQRLDVLTKLLLIGVDIFCLDFSSNSHEFHKQTLELVDEAVSICSEKLGYDVIVGIAMATKGPEICTGEIEGAIIPEVELKKDATIKLTVNADYMDKGTKEMVFVDYANIVNDVVPGNRIHIDRGRIVLLVKEAAVDYLVCQVEVGGTLHSHEPVLVPTVDMHLPPVTEKDRFDLKFALDNKIDMIFASKVRKAAAIKDIRRTLGSKGRNILIVAKIESLQALNNFNEIFAASDGIIFARGTVGVDLPIEKVFLAQKAVMARCNKYGKPGIVATQVLETMVRTPRPSRAEVMDLGNIVLDGADCVMLTNTTSSGPYPMETLQSLVDICREAEPALYYRDMFEDLVAHCPVGLDAAHAVAISAIEASKKSAAAAIVCLTTSGKSAYLLSKYRPRCPILAVTRCSNTTKQTLLHRGIVPILYTEPPNKDWMKEIDTRVQFALLVARRMQIVDQGDTVVVVSPWKDGNGYTNNMRIIYAFYDEAAVPCVLKENEKRQGE